MVLKLATLVAQLKVYAFVGARPVIVLLLSTVPLPKVNTPLGVLTRESAKVGVSRTHFDNQKLLAALPHFKFKPLENTLKEACIKYQAALSEGLISSH